MPFLLKRPLRDILNTPNKITGKKAVTPTSSNDIIVEPPRQSKNVKQTGVGAKTMLTTDQTNNDAYPEKQTLFGTSDEVRFVHKNWRVHLN